MRKFYQAIVNNPKKILVTFLTLTVFGAILRGMIPVNYDMADYLPEDSPSTIALDVMEDEFDGGIPNARVMVQNVTIPEALEYKGEIENYPGVSSVTWLDDAADILQPIETMDTDTVETYYKDNAALFTVTIEDGKQVEAVDAIRAIIGNENAMTGEAVSTAAATTGTVSEISKISVIAILFVFFMLILTTTSWMEPVPVMIGLGIAVLINSGSNLIFGEISFVTNAAGMILQIAVSLDYSVFLIHRFEECRREIPDPKAAMVDTLCKSTSSILSSGLTTVIGFLALLFMQLILATQKWLEKTKHCGFRTDYQFITKSKMRTIQKKSKGKE